MVLQNITGLTQNDFLLQLYMARIRLPLEHRHQHIKGFVGKLLRILTDGRQLRCGEHGVARIVKAEHLDLLRDADALSGRGIDHRLRWLKVKEYCDRTGISPAAVILAYLTSNPVECAPIIGCMTENEIADSLSAPDLTLAPDELRWFDAI